MVIKSKLSTCTEHEVLDVLPVSFVKFFPITSGPPEKGPYQYNGVKQAKIAVVNKYQWNFLYTFY